MKQIFTLVFLLCFAPWSFSQEDRISFSEAISLHISDYQERANKAYQVNDIERAEFLYDSLVEYCLKDSYLDNFKLHDLKNKEVYLEDFKKPIFLRTYASWLVFSEGEIPALNTLAEEYNSDIEIVLLFWDTQDAAKEVAKEFDDRITILYVDELRNKSYDIVRTMKHSLGFPTTFLLDRNKRIIDIRRKISHPFGISSNKSFDLNYNSISKGISLLLLEDFKQMNPQEKVAKLP